MTKEKLAQGYQIISQLEALEDAEIKHIPGKVRPEFYSNIRAEFVDAEEYNKRVKLRRKQLQEQLEAL